MAGVFDRLQKQIEDKQAAGGITALDLVDLPPALRKIMRLMLRKMQLKYPELCEAMDQMADDERMSRTDLDKTLEMLVEQAWLMQIGEGDHQVAACDGSAVQHVFNVPHPFR